MIKYGINNFRKNKSFGVDAFQGPCSSTVLSHKLHKKKSDLGEIVYRIIRYFRLCSVGVEAILKKPESFGSPALH